MKISEILNEVADSPYPWETKIDRDDFSNYTFVTSKGGLYNVWFVTKYTDNEKYTNIGFEMVTNPRLMNRIRVAIGKNLDREGSRTTITGTGDQYRILTTVLEIIRYYTQKHKPLRINFSAVPRNEKDMSRVKLYKAFINNKRLMNKYLPNYKFDSAITTHSGEVMFTLNRVSR